MFAFSCTPKPGLNPDKLVDIVKKHPRSFVTLKPKNKVFLKSPEPGDLALDEPIFIKLVIPEPLYIDL